MATLEKIREKSGLLLIFVGVALLAFVLGDLINSRSTFLGQEDTVAEIAGKKISVIDYQNQIDELTSVYEIQNGMSSLPADMAEQVRNSVWESTKREIILSKELDELGIIVTTEELTNIILGPNPHPYVLQMPFFQNPETGAFDRTMLANFINSLDDEGVTDENQKAQIRQARTFWKFWENLIKEQKLEEKYFMLLGKALNANSLEAKYAIDARKNVVDFDYITVKYASVPDSAVSVSDKEIEALYKKQKERFKQGESVDLRFVVFKINPSQSDYDEVSSWINSIKEEFVQTTDVADFVNNNSDEIFLQARLSQADIDPDFKEFAFTGKKGAVEGPLFIDNTYKMARIESNVEYAPDSIQLRHILVQEPTQERTKVVADSLVNVINSGSDFSTLALQFSKAPTAQRGGELGWLKEKDLDKELAAPAFNNKEEKAFVVETRYGAQILQITDRTKPVEKVLLAVVSRKVDASSQTERAIYEEANQFSVTNRTSDAFMKGAENKGYFVRSAQNASPMLSALSGVENSRQAIRWANDASEGAVSDVFEADDAFVVVNVVKKNEAGYKPLKDVKEVLKAELIKDKKYEKLVADLSEKKAKASGLQEIGTMFSENVASAKSINFSNSRISGLGLESALVAAVTLAQENVISEPVKGQDAAILFNVTNKVEVDTDNDIQTEMQNLSRSYMYKVPYTVVGVLESDAEIEDKRADFY